MSGEQVAAPGETGIIIFLSIAIILTGLAVGAFWLWMLIDCIKHEQPNSSQQIIWIVAMVVFPLFGAFIYNVGRRKQRIREQGH